MIDPKIVDDLARRISQALPSEPGVLRTDLENAAQAAVRAVLDGLDLVPREEFDAQAAVLAHTREKLERLEALVAELESQSPPPAEAGD